MTEEKKDWVKVYSTADRTLAEILKGTLTENDIPCVIMDKVDSSYLTFGEVELYVLHDQVLKAIKLIKPYEK